MSRPSNRWERSFGKYSSISIKKIPIEYADCYRIHEYDGLESVICDPGDLIVHTLKKLNIPQLNEHESKNYLQYFQDLANTNKIF